MKSVSCARLSFRLKRLSSPVKAFCLYMRRCMVSAWRPALSENTFAARPVGASSTVFCRNMVIVLTIAAAKEVLPVPAEPRKIITAWLSLSVMKRQNVSIATACSRVGTRPKACLMSKASSSTIISF